MRKRVIAPIFALGVVTGCASIEKPPERQHWDEASVSTKCTDDKSILAPQRAGSIIMSGLGGFDIGVGLAAGYVPVVGIGLATVGIASGADADKKLKEIEKCQEFKAYVAGRGSSGASENEVDETVQERLDRVQELRDSGRISEEEYKDSRKKILEEL